MPTRFIALALALAASTALFARNKDAGYATTILVANRPDYHPQIVEPSLIDAWGIALRPPGAGGHIWISNAGTGTSSEFIGDVPGDKLHQDGLKLVELDMPAFTDHGRAYVTGQAYNAASDLPGQPVEFPIAGPALNRKAMPPAPIPGGFHGAAKFVFVTEDGCINAWSANTAVAMERAPVMIDYSKRANWLPSPVNCVFTGVALTNNPAQSDAYRHAGGNHLFATDIRNNVIRVFDHHWKDVTATHPFAVPASVGGLHPFNIASLDGHVFVTYAQFDAASDEGQEQVLGPGLGHLVEYAEDGELIRDYVDHALLNAPWGIAIAPAGFGPASGKVLVANFGDGTVATFDRHTGEFAGFLRDSDTRIIAIDGIWGLTFGNGHSLGRADALYFSAGPNNEEDGLFGRIDKR